MNLVVVNHACTTAALALRTAFAPHAAVTLIDSGSKLTPAEQAGFDVVLPNVYYGGLLSAAVAGAHESDDTPLYFWCSDVATDDAARTVGLARETLADPRIGVYAPSAWFSGHPHMWHKATGGLRRVTFVEGFCFAARLGLLRSLCTCDLDRNPLGWGLDRHLGFIAAQSGFRVVVDDRIKVSHPRSTGYDTTAASRQRQAWVSTLDRRARCFHRVTGWGLAKRRPFVTWAAALPW